MTAPDSSLQPLSPPPSSLDSTNIISRVNNVLYSIDRIKMQFDAYKTNRKARNTFSVSVPSSDRFYFVLQKWLVPQIGTTDQRSLRAMGSSKGSLEFWFDDTNSQKIKINGHTITISSQKPKTGLDSFKEELMGLSSNPGVQEPTLVFIAQSEEGFKALKDKLAEIYEKAEKSEKICMLHQFTSWGTNTSTLRPRKLDSVVLAKGQKDRIIDDLDKFLKAEQHYVDRGIPYQRGYLFYGPPGTGKSSMVKAIAAHFNLDVYYVSLGAIHSDTDLNRTVSQISEKSIALFEDVDIFNAVKSREEAKSGGVSMSAFLNVLDGVLTPHGMIKILTTNDRSVIDPAVLRPGRIDMHEEIGLLADDQSDRMFEAFYEQPPSAPLGLQDVAPVQVMEVMKTHMYDPCAAEIKIREML